MGGGGAVEPHQGRPAWPFQYRILLEADFRDRAFFHKLPHRPVHRLGARVRVGKGR